MYQNQGKCAKREGVRSAGLPPAKRNKGNGVSWKLAEGKARNHGKGSLYTTQQTEHRCEQETHQGEEDGIG